MATTEFDAYSGGIYTEYYANVVVWIIVAEAII